MSSTLLVIRTRSLRLLLRKLHSTSLSLLLPKSGSNGSLNHHHDLIRATQFRMLSLSSAATQAGPAPPKPPPGTPAGSQSGSQSSDEDEDERFKRYEHVVERRPDHFKKELNKDGKTTGERITMAEEKNTQEYLLPHPIWSREELENVEITHRVPKTFSDKAAYYSVMVLRKFFDFSSGYTIGSHLKILDERSVLIRCIFLETVAGVPGFSAAMIRHLHSLRRMQRDHGWIHTLLEEAENERMHLMTFLTLKHPGPFFRAAVIVTQWGFTAWFMLMYFIHPQFCHRFVGYLEEQAVVTYTHILEEIDSGRLPMWERLPAPEVAVKYWQLPSKAMMRDVILAIRADEAHHREVNHKLSSMKLKEKNPFKPGE